MAAFNIHSAFTSPLLTVVTYLNVLILRYSNVYQNPFSAALVTGRLFSIRLSINMIPNVFYRQHCHGFVCTLFLCQLSATTDNMLSVFNSLHIQPALG